MAAGVTVAGVPVPNWRHWVAWWAAWVVVYSRVGLPRDVPQPRAWVVRGCGPVRDVRLLRRW